MNKASVGKFVNKYAPIRGGTEVKVALVKTGTVLKLVGNGLGDTPIDLTGGGVPPGDVWVTCTVENGVATVRQCTSFAGASCSYKAVGGGTGTKLVCKNGEPVMCPGML